MWGIAVRIKFNKERSDSGNFFRNVPTSKVDLVVNPWSMNHFDHPRTDFPNSNAELRDSPRSFWGVANSELNLSSPLLISQT